MQPWIDALRAIDERGNTDPLVELLKSNTPIPDEARWYVADLLDRYNLKRPRGGRRTPAYGSSEAVRQLEAAARSVRLQVKTKDRPRGQAAELAARVWGVGLETLHGFLDGKHSSARRQKKRRPPRP